MKLWLDDIRTMPDGFDIWCVTARGAIECISIVCKGKISYISFDHDLGSENICGTGYDVATYIEEAAFNNEIPRIKWDIHSANPVGRANIESAMRNADSYWDNYEISGIYYK